MLTNLISLLFLLALIALFGWLALRAWKAKRWFIKWPGLISSALLALIFAVVTFFGVKGLAFMYLPPAHVPDITIEGTPAQIARGAYLAGVACVGCHGDNGTDEFPLSGGSDLSGGLAIPIGKIVAANLTPGGVLAERTDGELFRAIRYGYGKGQRATVMTFMPYRQLSDEDTRAIIAFLRTQEPVTTRTEAESGLNILGAILLFGASLEPRPETIDGPIRAPAIGVNAGYGKYVATFGECRGCHGPNMTGREATLFASAYPNPRPVVSTLTLEEFVERMRTGRRPDGSEVQMPWENAARMSDEDLAALYTYLVAPVD